MLANQNSEPLKVPWSFSEVLWGTVPIVLTTLLGWLVGRAPRAPAPDPSVRVAGTIVGFFITYAILLAPVCLIAIRRHHATTKDFGLRSFAVRRAFGLIGLTVLLYLAESYLWTFVRGRRPLPFYFGHGPWALLLDLAFTSAMTPMIEELFFRGFLFPAVNIRFGFWIAALSSGLLFGLGHPAVVPQATLGIALPWLRERTGSLWPCIIVHSAINTIVVTTFFLRTGTA